MPTITYRAPLPRPRRAVAGHLTAIKQAELQLAADRTALAAGRHDQAAERALVSRPRFTAPRRDWWRNR